MFNRRSDLGTLEPIDGREVSCLHPECGGRFWITGDRVNSTCETLVFDCYELLERKHYMTCVVTLAQAYEMFFSLFFRVELAFRPFALGGEHDLDLLNRVLRDLEDAIQRMRFHELRCHFLRFLVDGRTPGDLAEAEVFIGGLKRKPRIPEQSEFSNVKRPYVDGLLRRVGGTTINKLRNAVVHKEGYQPSQSEAEICLEEARETLLPLTDLLDLDDDLNHYLFRHD